MVGVRKVGGFCVCRFDIIPLLIATYKLVRSKWGDFNIVSSLLGCYAISHCNCVPVKML
jgi:hypothetical protein